MMKINFLYVELPFTVPVPVRGRLMQKNRFLKVTAFEKDYYLSVLPQFHEITLEEVAFKLASIFSKYEFNFNEINLEKKYFNTLPNEDLLAEIQGEMLFQVESLILGIIKNTFPHLFSSIKIKTNDLFSDKYPISYYKNSECLKIKIHPKNALETLSIIKELHAENNQTIFRLDGNRRFEIWEMIEFHDLLQIELSPESFLRIDYIEEPFINFYDTFLFEKRSKLKIAIDESCINYLHDEKIPNIFVMKPSLIGLSEIFSLLRSRQNKRVIISSSYEHPTILLALQELAKLRPNEFHGLENFINLHN